MSGIFSSLKGLCISFVSHSHDNEAIACCSYLSVLIPHSGQFLMRKISFKYPGSISNKLSLKQIILLDIHLVVMLFVVGAGGGGLVHSDVLDNPSWVRAAFYNV